MAAGKALSFHAPPDGQPLCAIEEDTSELPMKQYHKRPWWVRFGTEALASILLGWLAMILGFTVLTLVWTADETSSTWKAIVYDNYGPQTVTVCSAAIRTAIGIQLGILTAAIASLILEHCDMPLSQIALLSIVRASTVAPHNIAMTTIRTPRYGRMKAYVVIGVIVAVAMTMISQLTSTILLSDFGAVAVKGYPYTENVLYSANFTTPGANYWLTKPPSYPRFAEYHEPALTGPDFLDTGTMLRGFFPIRAATDRTSLREYIGPMPVYDARVVCARPDIEVDSIQPILNPDESWARSQVYDALIINATIRFDIIGSLLHGPDRWRYLHRFSCLVPTTAAAESIYGQQESLSKVHYTQWQISVCRLQQLLDPQYLPSLRGPLVGNPAFNVTDAYILVNTTSGSPDWINVLNKTQIASNITFKTSNNGPWTNVQFPQESMNISFTLCFNKPYATNFIVPVASNANVSEPNLDLAGYGKFRTDSIRHQLQATGERLSAEDRGLFALPPPSTLRKLNNITRPDDKEETYASRIGDFVPRFEGASALMVSEGIGASKKSNVVHPAQVAVFQDILRSTQNPALALQAALTVLFSVRYYESFYAFAEAAPGTFTYSVLSTAPIRWTGFIIVAVTIAIHLVLQVVVLVLFLTATKYSDIGNCWKAIAQVVSEDTLPSITEAADVSEGRPKEWMGKRYGEKNFRFRLVKSAFDGRGEITGFERRTTGLIVDT